MIGYVIRRLLYGVLILIGVNLFTFILFFAVNTPDDMARLAIGGQRISQDAVEKWKVEHGYDKPLFYNAEAQGAGRLTDTVFYQRSVPLLAMEFGASDGGRDIGREIRTRMGPSLALAVPTFLLGLFVSIAFSLMLVYFRATRLDFWGVVLCVILLSISSLFYIIAGQWLFAKTLRLVPFSGFSGGLDMAKFLALPVLVAIISRLGPEARFYRTLFLEEIGRDYVRTARAKGLAERAVLFRHVLRNAMLPILTSTVAALPLLFMGSLIAESFFGIPGLGSYTIDAINAQDFSIVRAMVFLGASLYIVGLILADISYTLADPACVSSSRHAQDRLALDRYRALADGVGGAGLRLVRAPQSGAARHLGACRARHAGHVFGRDPGGLRHRRAARFRPLPAAAATGAGRAGRRRAAYAPVVRSALDGLLDGSVLTSPEKTYSTPLAVRQFTKETTLVDDKPVRDFRCCAARASTWPIRTATVPPTCSSASAWGWRAAWRPARHGLPGARRRGGVVAAAAEVLGARRTAVARHEPDLRFAVHGGGRVDRAVHRLSRAGHRPHRQRRAVAGLEEHPHGVGHRQPDHAGHAAAGHRVRHLGRLFQGQGRRRHPVPVHHHHLDSGRAAGGGLRADDAGLHRQPRRAVRHLGARAICACSCCA